MNAVNINVFVLCAIACTIHACTADKSHPRLSRSSNGVSVLELAVTSKVAMRYANVVVRSLMENSGSRDQEASFQVRLPLEAYITSFVLVTGNRTITAVIEERSVAQNIYDQAKKDNVTAAQVSQQFSDDTDTNIFKMEVNVAAKATVEFFLEYEELIQRHAGIHQQKLYVESKNVIPKMEVSCEIKEKQKFKMLTYRTPFQETHISESPGTLNENGYYVKEIHWKPSLGDQTAATTVREIPFEIEYDLEILETGGTVFMNTNGEFVHLFSVPCHEENIMTKQIVFVIDISGSMSGNPILQVRAAMKSILSQLRSRDYFNIVIFDNEPVNWKQAFQIASQDNIAEAKLFVYNKVIADGSTNINSALLQAVDLFDDISPESDRYGQIIVFLTDGSPTSGETDINAIRNNFREQNYIASETRYKSALYTIAFGMYADRDFLGVIAKENAGALIIIKDIGSNSADSDLVKVYKRLENPYFKNMMFSYVAENEDVPQTHVTQTYFQQFDCGNEISIGGWAQPSVEIYATVKANGVRNDVTFDSIPTILTLEEDSKMISRFAAYKMVKHFLDESETTTDPEKRKLANKEALALSLEYGFVTPLTSLVLTDYPSTHKPEGSLVLDAMSVSGGITSVCYKLVLILSLLVTVSVELTYRVTGVFT